MSFSFLTPVSEAVETFTVNLAAQTLGHKIKIHTEAQGIPDLETVNIAIIGVLETRNSVDSSGKVVNLEHVRKNLYALFPGNWHTNIADLGDIMPGETVKDTYFALRTLLKTLLEQGVIPVIIGGSQDLTYANYRAYDAVLPMINIVNVDAKFDLGDANLPIKNNSYIGKIIVESPYNLFNYAVLGYQTYFNSQEEIDLLDKLYFDACRLGEFSDHIKGVEPYMRDANLVSIDLKSVRGSYIGENQTYSPNGFSEKEICAISRYAGISNKVSSFGIYEYNNSNSLTPMLVAQMIWYFVEGVNYRIKDDDFSKSSTYKKYNVLIENEELIFYENNNTGRWWAEIPFLPNVNNKLKKHTLLPCMHLDYLNAVQGKIPERLYKAYKKNSF